MTTTFTFSQPLMYISHSLLAYNFNYNVYSLAGHTDTSWILGYFLFIGNNSKFQEEIYVLVAHDSPYNELLRFDKLSLWRMCQLWRSLLKSLPACVYSFHTIHTMYHRCLVVSIIQLSVPSTLSHRHDECTQNSKHFLKEGFSVGIPYSI